MNLIGAKFRKAQHLGHKLNKFQNMGHKANVKSTDTKIVQNTPDGYIENYANHPNNLYEPIKGINMPKIKKSYQIEKPKTDKKHNQNYE